ncbi:MAG: hypothetical protein EXS68_00480 [Candidatus Ryanbacteria bacterium]|nr:hypothetical protein [Candidatus Ryanbacteria bacterium]
MDESQQVQPAIPQLIDPPHRKRRRWPWVILAVVVFLGAFGYFLPSILGLFSRDIAPIDDSDLRLQKISIPDDQNAYFDLIKMSKVIDQGPSKLGEIVDGKLWDERAAADILQKNAEALMYFESAAQKSYYQDPNVADQAQFSPNVILPPLNTFRNMADVSAVKSLALYRQGKIVEALEEAFRAASIGQKMQNSQSHFIGYLVGFAIKSRALRTMQIILQESEIDSQSLKTYTARLERFYDNEEAMATAFKAEYWGMTVWAINAMTSQDPEKVKAFKENFGEQFGGAVDSYHFRPNETKLLFADLARAQVRDSKKHCGALELQEIKPSVPYGDSWTILAQQYITENVVGKTLHDVVAAAFGNAQYKRCREDYLVASTQVAMAIKAFKNDTKVYPASLTELIPKYLSKVPEDPFDGAALKYDASTKTIYSTGEKLRESGDERYKSLGELKLQLAF